MRKVACAEHGYALDLRPVGEVGYIHILAGRARVFGMYVQIGDVAHILPSFKTCLPAAKTSVTAPLSFQPIKGEFLLLETIKRSSKAHSFAGSMMAMSATAPFLRVPRSISNILAGLADILIMRPGQSSTPPAMSSVAASARGG